MNTGSTSSRGRAVPACLSLVSWSIVIGHSDGNDPSQHDDVVPSDSKHVHGDAGTATYPALVNGRGDVGMNKSLTPREVQVLRLNAFGLTNPSIAKKLGLSSGTIQTYQTRIREKLGAVDRCHAVAIGYESGLIRLGTTVSGLTPPGIDQRISFLEEQVTKLIKLVVPADPRRSKWDER